MRDIGGNPKINISRKPSSPMTEGKREKAVFSAPVEAGTIVGLPAKSCIHEAAGREGRRDPRAYSSPQPPPHLLNMGPQLRTLRPPDRAEQGEGKGGKEREGKQVQDTHIMALPAMMGKVEGEGQGLVVKKGTWSLAIYILVEDMKWALHLLFYRKLTHWD